jgi:5'-nucleotidase / UDP-sugar diphosphatase
MRQARSARSLFRSSVLVALAMLSLGVASGCGATAAQPTPTAVPPTSAAAAPAPSPQRPPLASPVPSPSAPVTTTSPAAVSSPEPEQTYEVQAGDTLLSIAEQFYGDATRWRRIYDANRDTIGPDPDKLKLETKLKIPPKDG